MSHTSHRKPSPGTPTRLISAANVADQHDVSRRTIARWLKNLELNFPRPIIINGRLYFEQTKLETWKVERATKHVEDRKTTLPDDAKSGELH